MLAEPVPNRLMLNCFELCVSCIKQVEVDLGMNAAANARVRHEARKRAAAKQRKTLAANEKALAAAEKRTTVQLAQVGGVSHFELQCSWFGL